MAPTRTAKTRRQDAPPNKAGPSKPHPRRNQPEKESAGVPGVQKIKSSLRQTRRLLAKDNLAADVRVETERRLKALEADLLQAESSKKERALAVRYHKIKFFGKNILALQVELPTQQTLERQKVVRKLTQTRKQLAGADADSRAQLEATVSVLRVDLNYILHYPKTKKYMSLFPPEIRQGEGKPTSKPSDEEMAKTSKGREEVRSWIRGRMERGELSTEPELHLDARGGSSKKSSRGEEWGVKPVKGVPAGALASGGTEDMEDDAFFGDDDDDESE